MTAVVNYVQSLLANAAVTTLLIFTVCIPLLRLIVTERVKKAIGFEYDSKLQALKAAHDEKLEALKASNTVIADDLRAIRAEREMLRNMATSILLSARSGLLERRASAMETLWNALQDYRAGVPQYIYVLDLVGFDVSKLGSRAKEELKNADLLSCLTTLLKLSDAVTKTRPFLGDQLFSLYFAEQAVIGRAISTTISSFQANKTGLRLWYEEHDTLEVVKTVLSPEEFAIFQQLRTQKLEWLIKKLESKIVAEIQQELSGAPGAEQAMQHAGRILKAVAEMNDGTANGQ